MDQQLTELQQKAIFEALVEAQDQEMTVAQSRQFIAGRFGVTEERVRQIEREGLERLWPPL
jgi:DNA-directed RNA polymerase sigma subunit (sigma70/sigma32)